MANQLFNLAGSWILDPKLTFQLWILDPGSLETTFQLWIPGSWIPQNNFSTSFGSWILDPRTWILDPGSEKLDPGSQNLDPGSQAGWILDPGSEHCGSWILDPKLDPGSRPGSWIPNHNFIISNSAVVSPAEIPFIFLPKRHQIDQNPR